MRDGFPVWAQTEMEAGLCIDVVINVAINVVINEVKTEIKDMVFLHILQGNHVFLQFII